jgi:hypothetical protein
LCGKEEKSPVSRRSKTLSIDFVKKFLLILFVIFMERGINLFLDAGEADLNPDLNLGFGKICRRIR